MKFTPRCAFLSMAAFLLTAPATLVAQGPPPPPGGYYQQGPGNYQQGPGGWDAPPNEYTRDLQRNAFHDGLYGAQKDYENRRQPNVRNRDEFRNYRGPERREYREAFARGYNAWWNHPHEGFRGDGDHDHDHDRDHDRDGDRRFY